MPDLPPFTGAVLAGGTSRRMGRDKAFLVLDGRPLAATVAHALLEAGADPPVLAIGGDGPALFRLGLATVADEYPGQGPLGGIVTALTQADHDVVVILACDVPGADADAVARVVSALQADLAADVAVPVHDGRQQPLHGAWRRGCLPTLRRVFAEGERGVSRALNDLRMVSVVGIPPQAVADVDTPGDLERGGWSNGYPSARLGRHE